MHWHWHSGGRWDLRGHNLIQRDSNFLIQLFKSKRSPRRILQIKRSDRLVVRGGEHALNAQVHWYFKKAASCVVSVVTTNVNN